MFQIRDILAWIRKRIQIKLRILPSKNIFFSKFLLFTFWRYIYIHHSLKIKSQKEPQKSWNQGFSYYFCLMMEGCGSAPLTNGSGTLIFRMIIGIHLLTLYVSPYLGIQNLLVRICITQVKWTGTDTDIRWGEGSLSHRWYCILNKWICIEAFCYGSKSGSSD